MTRRILLLCLLATILLWFFNLERFAANPSAAIHSEARPAQPGSHRQHYHDAKDSRPQRIHEAFPFSALTKNWAVSAGMKAYFDDQRNILAQMEALATPASDTRIALAAMGDLMRMPASQQGSVHSDVLAHLARFDLVTANLETLISPRYPLPPDSLFLMNSNPEIVQGFRDANGKNLLSLLSLANNHIVDYPDDAIEDTLQILEQEQIQYHGLQRSAPSQRFALVERNGLRVAYYAATTFVNNESKLTASQMQLTPMLEGIRPLNFYPWKSFADIDLTELQQVLQEMDAAGADLKIISLHWGREHVMYPEPVQMDIAHALVAAGADVVIGAHTHVPQPAEICFINGYEQRLDPALANEIDMQGCKLTAAGQPRKGIIFYSLGNFRGYSASFWQQLGTIAQLQVYKTAGITDWQFKGFTFTYDQQERPPDGKRHLVLLDRYIEERCQHSACPDTQVALAEQAKRHLLGHGLSALEEVRMAWLSLYDSGQRFLALAQ